MAELILERISKTFVTTQEPRKVLDDVTFKVRSGEFVVLLGPSGCGKTTLLKIIAGLVPPDSNDHVLTIDGRPITAPGPDRNIVFQNYTSYPWLTVFENVRFSLRFSGLPIRDQHTTAEEYVRLVRLWDYRDEYPRVLSGGQQQRVALARTLAAKPQVILMDEPFAALDAQTREDMQSELLQLREKTGCTVVFVTHDIAEAAFLGDRVLILSRMPATVTDQLDAKTERELISPSTHSVNIHDVAIPDDGDGFRYAAKFVEVQRRLKDKLLAHSNGGPR